MAIQGLPFGLSPTTSSTAYNASSLGLKAIATIIVANHGPGAVGVWSGGSPSGAPFAVIGALQRKHVAIGGASAFCLGILPLKTTFTDTFTNILATRSCSGVAIACDDYSLGGEPEEAEGQVYPFILGPTQTGFFYAEDAGFDKIRGVYIPPPIEAGQTAPVIQYCSEPLLTGTFPIHSEGVIASSFGEVANCDLALVQIAATGPFTSVLLSDQPFAIDLANRNAINGAVPQSIFVAANQNAGGGGPSTLYTVPSGRTLLLDYIAIQWFDLDAGAPIYSSYAIVERSDLVGVASILLALFFPAVDASAEPAQPFIIPSGVSVTFTSNRSALVQINGRLQ